MAATTSSETRADAAFADIFRRADKNDDGCLSIEEFRDFFADGVMSTSQLDELFNDIDTDNSGNIDTSELAAYFKKDNGFGVFQKVFSTIDQLNQSVSGLLHSTHATSASATARDQFNSRFLLKEAGSHIEALLHPLDCAYQAISKTSTEACDQDHFPHMHTVSQSDGVSTKRMQRRAKATASGSSVVPATATATAAESQMDRLEGLIQRLENQAAESDETLASCPASVSWATIAAVVAAVAAVAVTQHKK